MKFYTRYEEIQAVQFCAECEAIDAVLNILRHDAYTLPKSYESEAEYLRYAITQLEKARDTLGNI